MEPDKIIEIVVSHLDDQGRGIADWRGLRLAIPFSIPGERFRIEDRLLRKPPGLRGEIYLESEKTERISSSPDRRDPPCPYFGVCGGCQLQHMNEGRQLEEKENWLKRILGSLVSEDILRPIIAAPKNWHYRRRIQLHAGRGGGVGYFARGSQRVVEIEECPIACEEINREIPRAQEMAARELKRPRHSSLLTFEMTLMENSEVKILPPQEGRYFLQINAEANGLLLKFLKRILEETKPKDVLELFAGSGNFTLALGKGPRSWTAVESNRHAWEMGKKELGADFPPANWKLGEADVLLERLLRQRRKFDLVLLDPPREGAASCMASLKKLQTPAICYISCYPVTLAKDLKLLCDGGYQIQWIQPFDFFPQTMHLETVVWCGYKGE